MKIAAYLPKDNALHCEVITAFMEGIRSRGLVVDSGSVDMCIAADIAIVFGIGKKAVPASIPRGEILRARGELGKNTIVLEMGYIKRDMYYAAGWNNLNGRADFLNDNMPSDRFKALGIDMTAYNAGTENTVIICGQVPWDASVQHTDHLRWISDTVLTIKTLSEFDIIVRPHPLAISATPSFLGARLSRNTLEEDLQAAHAVITFNSNTGVDAIINGKATFVGDVGSMVYPVANKDLRDIIKPKYYERDQWASNLAYTQWTLEEMACGLPFLHLTRYMFSKEKKAGAV